MQKIEFRVKDQKKLSKAIIDELPFLSTIIIGGDSTSSEAIKYWSQGRRFINSYGPAENAVDATYSVMQPNSSVNDIGCNVSGIRKKL